MTDPPLLTPAFVRLVAGHFLQALGYSSMLLLPLYLSHLGASRAQVGTIMATGAVGGLVLRPMAGWALDAVGRKIVVWGGTIALAGGMGLIGLCDSLGWLIYASRLLVGIGAGTLFTAYFAWAADVIPPSRRTEGIALFGISGLVPLLVNPVADRVGVDAPGLRWFLPLLGLVVLLSLLPVLGLEEPRRPRRRQPSESSWIRVLAAPPLWSVWWATVVFASAVSVFMAFATVVAEARGVARPADLWFAYAVAAVAVRGLGPRLPQRLGPRNMVAPALGCYGAAFLLAAGAEGGAGFVAAGALAGVGHGYCFPVLTGQVVERSPERLRGGALAVFTALWEVAAIGATPLFGWVADGADDATMFSAAALMGVGGLAVWAALERRALRTPDRSG